MAITAVGIASSIKGYLALVGFQGRDMGKLADAIGRAVYIHLVTPDMAVASITGTVGPVGSVTNVSVQGIVPTVMQSLMTVKGASSGFSGRDLNKLSQAISNGISIQLMTMMLTGTTAGLAIGAGTATLTGINSTVLGSLLKAAFASVGFTGRDMLKLADMISSGVVQHLQTSASFAVIATGAIAPTPPTGPVPIAGIPTIFSQIS